MLFYKYLLTPDPAIVRYLRYVMGNGLEATSADKVPHSAFI